MRVFEAFSEGQTKESFRQVGSLIVALSRVPWPSWWHLSLMTCRTWRGCERKPGPVYAARLELVDVWRRCFLMTVMCFFFWKDLVTGGWFCGYQLRDLQNYMLFRSRTTNILVRGFSVTWMRVNDLLWRLSKQSAFGGCVLLESEGVVGPYLP